LDSFVSSPETDQEVSRSISPPPSCVQLRAQETRTLGRSTAFEYVPTDRRRGVLAEPSLRTNRSYERRSRACADPCWPARRTRCSAETLSPGQPRFSAPAPHSS